MMTGAPARPSSWTGPLGWLQHKSLDSMLFPGQPREPRVGCRTTPAGRVYRLLVVQGTLHAASRSPNVVDSQLAASLLLARSASIPSRSILKHVTDLSLLGAGPGLRGRSAEASSAATGQPSGCTSAKPGRALLDPAQPLVVGIEAMTHEQTGQLRLGGRLAIDPGESNGAPA